MYSLSEFTPIPYFLFIVFTVCLANYLFGKVLLPKNNFNIISKNISLLFSINLFLLLILEIFFKNKVELIYLSPFPLLYGPVLYLAIKGIKEVIPSKKKILIHFCPFAILSVSFLALFVLKGENQNTALKIHTYLLFIFVSLSLISYSYYPFSKVAQIITFKKNQPYYLIIYLRILLLVTGLFFTNLYYSQDPSTEVPSVDMNRTFIYLVILLMEATSLLSKIGYLKKFIIEKSNNFYSSENLKSPKNKYHKSLISEELMEMYQVRLERKMMKNKFFLDKKLSLDNLSQKTNIPNHHLSQLFNLHFNQSFYNYINNLRIEYACELLKEKDIHQKYNIEQLATDCGFNSKVSFNRHFKKIKKCTPSEFLKECVKK